MTSHDDCQIDHDLIRKQLNEQAQRRQRDLNRAFAMIAETRAPFLKRLGEVLSSDAEAGEARAMLEARLRRLGERRDACRAGLLSRSAFVSAEDEDELPQLDPKHRDVIIRAHDAAGSQPRLPDEAIELITGITGHRRWLEPRDLPGFSGAVPEWIATMNVDTGTIGQALGGDGKPGTPPSVDLCVGPAYPDQATAVSGQVISSNFAFVTQSTGRVATYSNAAVSVLVPGFGSAIGEVAADVDLPSGVTSVRITAEINFDVSLYAGAVASACWSVADLVMATQHADGSTSDATDWVGTQVAPVLWTGQQQIKATRVMVHTRGVSAGGGRLRILVGTHSYSNAPTGVVGFTESLIQSTVRTVCIHAE